MPAGETLTPLKILCHLDSLVYTLSNKKLDIDVYGGYSDAVTEQLLSTALIDPASFFHSPDE